jgi:hypothetical protein
VEAVEQIDAEWAPVCRSVCTPVNEALLEAAIARLTRALATAEDDALAAVVDERRALREELRELRERAAIVTDIEDRRMRRGSER